MNHKVKRLLAAIIDFCVICFLSSALVCITTWGKMDVTPFSITLYFGSFVLLLLFKDFVFKNASVGKRVFKMKIIKTDETSFTIIDALKRTIPIILLPIELLLIMANNQRIGDIWAKTSVVPR